MAKRAGIVAVLVAGVLIAGCTSSGSDGPHPKSTTTTAPAGTTTTEAGGGSSETGLPSKRSDAPSGDWISVRFNISMEPEASGFSPGQADARLYDIVPDCSGDGCTLTVKPGGDDGSFGMPGTQPTASDPIVFEPDGEEWTASSKDSEAYGCTDELDGPYIESEESRTFKPVYDDEGAITGLVGTYVVTDRLTDEGRDAGCPADAAATWSYAVVASPSGGIRATDGWSVDGTFRQTREITESENYTSDMLQVGAQSMTNPENDIDLSGDCGADACTIALSQALGNGNQREMALTADDGLTLTGSADEVDGCTDGTTGSTILEDGAYDVVSTYESLVPVWIEDGKAKVLVGEYVSDSNPTELAKAHEECAQSEHLRAWVYLVDVDAFDV